MARDVERSRHEYPTLAVERSPETGGERRALDAGGPEHRAGADPGALGNDARRIDRLNLRGESYLDAQLLEAPSRLLLQGGREARQHRGAGLQQQHARALGVNGAKVPAQSAVQELGQSARELDAGGAAADHDEREQLLLAPRIRLSLGTLQGHEQAPAEVERILQRLEPGCKGGPLVMPEVGGLCAGRNDQVVVGQLGSIVERQQALGEIDAFDFGHHHGGVLLFPEHGADRVGNLVRPEASRGHLVQKRLEQVVIPAIDDGDPRGRVAQPSRREQSGKACAYHHDVRPALCGSSRPLGYTAIPAPRAGRCLLPRVRSPLRCSTG